MSNSGPIIITKSANVVRGPRIPGVFPSVRFGEQVLSTGVPSLDSYIGGGVPIGSICILKDTFPSRFADLVLKCFVAEGASYSHNLYVASGRVPSQEFVNELPSLRKFLHTPEEASLSSMEKQKNSDGALKIAWRYQPQGNTGTVGKGHKEAKFEFTNKCTAAELGGKYLTVSKLFDNDNSSSGLDSISADSLINEIASVVQPFEIPITGAPTYSNVVRLAISHCDDQILNQKFMTSLRALVRHTNSCVVLSISNLTSFSENLSRCEHYADYVITLQAVFDEHRRSELGDIDGICEFVKITSINSLKPIDPPRDIGFSFKKKRLIFQELHLPPEGETTTQREVSPSSVRSPSSSTCGSTIQGKSIDF